LLARGACKPRRREEHEGHEEDHLVLGVLRGAPLLDRRIFVVSLLQRRGKTKKKIFFVVFVVFVTFVVCATR
jgi:hypothetical protein